MSMRDGGNWNLDKIIWTMRIACGRATVVGIIIENELDEAFPCTRVAAITGVCGWLFCVFLCMAVDEL